ncbi:MAG: tRNA (adenosine(37)-N6)-threonylcarbamoyltransferase complex ATPase subunit type 1 TsaE [Candidatus Pacebacteria bacterium]|nr:tRNA (adenosine(37)-N6)-threonylcarbamoyltransferase complex ATPase subunit type 1 TsaE [Candidatus Paceibacterota bacterium]MDD3729171.1 tRNA (adenosine(37)-N6)-threonylcarbamoyltransferase complex ATPase subunit type 1 TsaE [Candidatus Paceibacterota bacterium]MDD4201737.1 tRNA (adenosine(37)-N6)-threonylcarbamoyltransferase complex ATPase subunit type 1 TsaE [Candidatus Paceibacterota bacterium]MDD4897559.1 tRNA (adenosine(37)-N6)-threonylcarbamoyltransferase complex ATPase subunit type 1 
MNYTFLSSNSSKTEKEGELLGKKILKEKKEGVVLALSGDLGAGKTTFLKGFAKGIGVKEKILSPTFVIFRKMPISKERNFFHFDCYRLKNEKDLFSLGFEEIIKNKKNIIAIEWPEKIKKSLPYDSIFINFEFISGDKRKISIHS